MLERLRTLLGPSAGPADDLEHALEQTVHAAAEQLFQDLQELLRLQADREDAARDRDALGLLETSLPSQASPELRHAVAERARRAEAREVQLQEGITHLEQTAGLIRLGLGISRRKLDLLRCQLAINAARAAGVDQVEPLAEALQFLYRARNQLGAEPGEGVEADLLRRLETEAAALVGADLPSFASASGD